MAWKLSDYKFSVRTPQGPENTAVVPVPVETQGEEAKKPAKSGKKKNGKKKGSAPAE